MMRSLAFDKRDTILTELGIDKLDVVARMLLLQESKINASEKFCSCESPSSTNPLNLSALCWCIIVRYDAKEGQ
jgi:hypothetical protein